MFLPVPLEMLGVIDNLRSFFTVFQMVQELAALQEELQEEKFLLQETDEVQFNSSGAAKTNPKYVLSCLASYIRLLGKP